MTSLIQYVSRILIISLPAVVVFLCFMPYRMRALKAMNLHSGWQREIGLILFVVSIFGILALTLWPTYIWEDSPGIWGDIRILIDRPAWKSSLSVVPFSVFKDYYEDEEPHGKSSVSCPLKPSDSAPLKHSTMPP